jgi:phage-related protein
MNKIREPKEVIWIGDSRKRISKFPMGVKRAIGHALYFAQRGAHHPDSKIMKGLGSGLYEIVENHREGTFRAIYLVRYLKRIYILHAFQKKSKSGIRTPQEDIELIKKRLKLVMEIENDKS